MTAQNINAINDSRPWYRRWLTLQDPLLTNRGGAPQLFPRIIPNAVSTTPCSSRYPSATSSNVGQQGCAPRRHRRLQSFDDSSSNELVPASGSLRSKWRSMSGWCHCASPCIPIGLYLSNSELDEYARLYDRATRPADQNNPVHVELLHRYWRVLMPNRDPPQVPDWRWQLVGFQSSSPWTDFRGGGSLALELMSEFSSYHPSEVQRIAADCLPALSDDAFNSPNAPLDLVTRTKTYYPFSAAFINVEFALVHLLRLNADLAKCLDAKFRPHELPEKRIQLCQSACTQPFFRRGPKLAVKNFGTLLSRYRGHPSGLNPAMRELFAAACYRMHTEWMRLSGADLIHGFSRALETSMTIVVDALIRDDVQEVGDLYRWILS